MFTTSKVEVHNFAEVLSVKVKALAVVVVVLNVVDVEVELGLEPSLE